MRFIVLMLCLVCTSAVAGSSQDDAEMLETISVPSMWPSHAPDHARDAGLAPLSSADRGPEVRVWRSIAVLGLTDGWVITPGRIDRYTNGYRKRDVMFHGGAISAGDSMRFHSRIHRIAANALIRAATSTNPGAPALGDRRVMRTAT